MREAPAAPHALPLFSGLGDSGQSRRAERDFQPEGLRKVWASEWAGRPGSAERRKDPDKSQGDVTQAERPTHDRCAAP